MIYLFVVKNYLTIEKYPEYITSMWNKIKRENEKREFRKKVKNFFCIITIICIKK